MGRYFSSGCYWLLLAIMFLSSSGCIVEERAALMDINSWFSNVWGGHASIWQHGDGDDCCSWKMVTCNHDTHTRRVSHLNLSSDNFYVPQLPMGIVCWHLNLSIFSAFHELQLLNLSGNSLCLHNLKGLQRLSKLRYLILNDNTLIGNIPESLGEMVSLQVINIERNNISGPLPDAAFWNLRNLRELYLRTNQLSGNLPESLFTLQKLEYVDLAENLLQGNVPINSSWVCPPLLRTIRLYQNKLSGNFDFLWLRNCTKLEKINLSRNTGLVVWVKSHGWVPAFQLKKLTLSWCNLDKSIIKEPHFLLTQHHLQILDLSNNNLPGSMPNWMFRIGSLVYLDLANNSLVGSVDPIWTHHPNLQLVNISMNYVTGQLPANIGIMFPMLRILDASHNLIFGKLPQSLCSRKDDNMKLMDLSNNNFTGEVPSYFFSGGCPALEMLKLSDNSLRGSILDGVSFVSVGALYLDGNSFEGTLPRNLTGDITIMDLHDNKISGELDLSLWNVIYLGTLTLGGNKLSGQIPPAICQLTSLHMLDLSGNYFAGPIPTCSSRLPLGFLNLSGNSLSGSPGAFFDTTSMSVLDLTYNQFTGSFDWMRKDSPISVLLLRGNKFEGQIISNLCHLRYLSIADISRNKLSGSIPPCIGTIPFDNPIDFFRDFWPTIFVQLEDEGSEFYDYDSYITYDIQYALNGFTFTTKGNPYTYGHNFFMSMSGMDLSANMLSGEIPQELGNLSHVKSINLSHNFLTGPIPETFAHLSEIESLDISRNRLSGHIPWQLSWLSSLEVFSVAYNNLSGCVPKAGQLGTFDMNTYKGNNNLKSCSSSSGSVVPTPSVMVKTMSNDFDRILYVVSVTSFVLSFWATVIFVFYHSTGQRVILKLSSFW